MKISGINNKQYPDTERSNTDLWMDSEGKEVRNEIADAKNRLKELSTDKGLNEEEREKKRQEIQQKIADLNQKLRQRQMELQREQQEQKKASAVPSEDNAESAKNSFQQEEPDSVNLSQHGSRAIFAAHSAIQNATSQEALASALESQARILQGEIKQDEERGKDTRIKQEELKKLEKKATQLNRSGFGFLTDASKEIRQAAKKDNPAGKKSAQNNPDGFVRPLKSPISSAPKRKTDIYIQRNMFSSVDFHF